MVTNAAENFPAQIFEVFAIGFSDFSQEQAFEAGETLAIVQGHLSEHPKGFSTAAGAAKADGGGAVGLIANASGRAGGELARL
jgi:hypothetical protein